MRVGIGKIGKLGFLIESSSSFLSIELKELIEENFDYGNSKSLFNDFIDYGHTILPKKEESYNFILKDRISQKVLYESEFNEQEKIFISPIPKINLFELIIQKDLYFNRLILSRNQINKKNLKFYIDNLDS